MVTVLGWQGGGAKGRLDADRQAELELPLKYASDIDVWRALPMWTPEQCDALAHPTPSTLHSKPETRNLKPETRNPKQETHN